MYIVPALLVCSALLSAALLVFSCLYDPRSLCLIYLPFRVSNGRPASHVVLEGRLRKRAYCRAYSCLFFFDRDLNPLFKPSNRLYGSADLYIQRQTLNGGRRVELLLVDH